jgi:hypothetical protein
MRHPLAPVLLSLAAACGQPFSAKAPDLDGSSGGSHADSAPENDTTPARDSGTVSDAAGDGAMLPAEMPPVGDGLLLWLRADVGVTETNGDVSNWADQSGNHLDARQPDPLQQPTWLEAGFLEQPAVIFNAENFLSLPGGFADFSRGISIFTVATLTDPASCVDFVHLSNGPEIDDIALGRHDGKAHIEVFNGDLFGQDFSLGHPHLVSVVQGTDGFVDLRLDGGSSATATLDLPSTGTRLSNVIGRSLYAGCGSVHGPIAEVLVYRRALDDGERTRVETSLQERWGCCR